MCALVGYLQLQCKLFVYYSSTRKAWLGVLISNTNIAVWRSTTIVQASHFNGIVPEIAMFRLYKSQRYQRIRELFDGLLLLCVQ